MSMFCRDVASLHERPKCTDLSGNVVRCRRSVGLQVGIHSRI